MLSLKLQFVVALLLQEFDLKRNDKLRAENVAIDYLSRLENGHLQVLNTKDKNSTFLNKHLYGLQVTSDFNTPMI